MPNGYVVSRLRKSGLRHTAYVYDESGKAVSAGTFDTRAEAEASLSNGYQPHPVNGSGANRFMRYDDYALEVWLPSVRQPNTRKGYRAIVTRHVLPTLGAKRLCDITRQDIEAVIRHLEQLGRSQSLIHRTKVVMSTSFTPIVESGVMAYNPCFGVKVRRPPKKKRKPILPDEMKLILKQLELRHGVPARLFASFIIETGIRFGEATEVRPSDIDWRTGAVVISRAVADVGASENPAGTGRFYVKEPKGYHSRITGVTRELLAELKDYVADNSISESSLLFPLSLIAPRYQHQEVIPEVDLSQDFGLTEPNDKGFVYRHGTTTAYQAAGCRCEYCRAAIRQYRREYRSKYGLRQRDPENTNQTGHLPRDVWRRMWRETAGEVVDWNPRTHDMRHANATWLLKGGMDLHAVKSRLGHSSVTTTEEYLHDLEAMDSRANDVMAGFLH